MPEGIRVLDAATRKFGIDLQFDHFDQSRYPCFEGPRPVLQTPCRARVFGPCAAFAFITNFDAVVELF